MRTCVCGTPVPKYFGNCPSCRTPCKEEPYTERERPSITSLWTEMMLDLATALQSVTNKPIAIKSETIHQQGRHGIDIVAGNDNYHAAVFIPESRLVRAVTRRELLRLMEYEMFEPLALLLKGQV